jgi:predicted permease
MDRLAAYPSRKERIVADIRYALRMLARTPVITAVLILSLAFGIGANTAMFSIIQQILMRRLPVQNPQELVNFYHPGPVQGSTNTDEEGMPSFSYPMMRDLQVKQTPFTGVAGFKSNSASLSYQNTALPGSAQLVTGNYFDILQVKPAMGRLLGLEDDKRPGEHFVVVLSHGYWMKRMGGRADVLNQSLVVNGYPMTIVGVTPKEFTGETLGNAPDVYVPISMKAQITLGWKGFENRRDYWINLVGRMKPGMTQERAAEEINSVYRAMLPEEAKLLTQPSKRMLEGFLNKKIILKPGEFGRGGMRKESAMPIKLLTGITLFVLLIACANAANLLLAKSASRRKEIAVRLSMGASRARLVRQLLTEAWIVALGGGVLGLLVARWTLDAMLAAIPQRAVATGFLTSELNLPVLAYCLAASLITGVLFGLYPALQATKPDVAPTLKDQGDQMLAAGAKWFRGSLVAGQVAMSLMLLITAGLLVASLVKLTRVDLGINADRLITFGISPQLARYDSTKSLQFFERLEEKLGALPGVTMVSASTVPFLAGSTWNSSIVVEGYRAKGQEDSHSRLAEVGPGFFATMGIPLLSGREFTKADTKSAPKVVVVNEAFAKRYFGDGNPLGRRMGTGFGDSTKLNMEIVGVVRDSLYSSLQNERFPVFYMAYRQDERIGGLNYYVRTGIDSDSFTAMIRREVAGIDPNIPISGLKTMRVQIDESIFAERLVSTFAGTFAGLATVLAAIGLYGVLAYAVARRTREIGIRMALGAGTAQVRGLVMREVVTLVGVGSAIGLAAALGLGRFLEAMLFGVKSKDPVVIVCATALLGTIALIAGYLPARRATRIDPMIALRYE